MPLKHNRSAQTWTILGGPQGGTISALAIGQDKEGYHIFIGSPVGLYRSTGFENGVIQGWERLSGAPLGIMSLVVSPDFTEDHTVIAGTHAGIYLSENGGKAWRPAQMPPSNSMVLSLGFSPEYLSDGIILAGTLEDGVLISDSRGARWLSQSFRLLDPTAYCLAISPDFPEDGLIFAGTGTTLYYSYNAGRAWRPLDFPDDAAPVLSMVLLKEAGGNLVVFAGTDSQGLYRSRDQGESWQKLDLPAVTVNSLLALEDGGTLVAATENGILQSKDQGESWTSLLNMPDVIVIAFKGELAVAGVAEQGVWMSANLSDWQPVENLAIRSLLGMALSPQFEKDGLAYLYGPEEGIWKTEDGGRTWKDLNEPLPSLEINSLALSPGFPVNQILVAATKDGLLISRDGGNEWDYGSEEPAQLAVFSPNGRILAAVFAEGGVKISEDLGVSWQNLPGPWDAGGQVLAIAATNLHQYFIAHLEGIENTMTLWQGKTGQLEKVLSQTAGANPQVSFWFPSGAATERPWYASMEGRVWKISSRVGGAHLQSSPISEDTGESIVAITGTLDASGQILLFACTGEYIYSSQDARSWVLTHDFGSERSLVLSLSPSFQADRTAYALLLGGSFCKLKL